MIAAKNQKRKRRLKIFAVVFVAFVLIFYLVGETYIENLISKEVQKQLNSNPSRHYDLKTGPIKIRFLSGNIWIKDLTIKPTDSAMQLLNDGQLKSLMELHFRDIEIKGLKAIRFLTKKNMDMHRIKANDIDLALYSNPNANPQTDEKKLSIKDLLTNQFVGAAIDQFEINNLALSRFLYADTSNPTLRLDSIYLSFSAINLDSSTIKQTIPVQFENLKINSADVLLRTSKFYKIATEDVAFNLSDSTLTIGGFQLIPRFSKEDFSKQLKYNTDWFDISAPKIEFKYIHLSELIKNDNFHVSSIVISQPSIDIFRDKTLPDKPLKHKPLLSSMLKGVPSELLLDSLIINDGKLLYGETPKEHKQAGQLFFEPFELKAFNITNMDSVISLNNNALINFNAKLMGKSDLSTIITLDLGKESDYFEVEGKLGKIPASALNPMVENLLFVSIIEGDIKKTRFYFYANDDYSSGEVFLEYDGLKVEVLNADDKSKQRKAHSFIANNLIRNSNLNTDRKYLVGQINYERDKNKGLPNYIWNSVKTGIISIVAPVASKDSKAEKRKGKNRKKKN